MAAVEIMQFMEAEGLFHSPAGEQEPVIACGSWR